MTELTESQLNKLMQYAADGADEPDGDGWKTKHEWIEEFSQSGKKMGEKRFYKMIDRLTEQGLAEVYRGTRVNGSGYPRHCVWYRIFFDKMED